MARPKKMGMDYFPHDTDAAGDEKIEALRSMFGNDGYAFYFILLERVYRTPDFELDISGSGIIIILAKKVGVSYEKFMDMLEFALTYGCFDKKLYQEKKVLTSSGIKKRAGVVVEKRTKMQERYRLKEQPASIDPVSEAEMVPETPQSKEEKSIEKKTKQEESKEDNSSKGTGDDDNAVSIIDYFSEKSGILMPDSRDLMLAQKLASEMPVNVVKTGIDEAFKRFKPKRQGEGIKTLRYCEGCIMDMWDIEKAKGGVINGYHTSFNRADNDHAKKDWTGFLYGGEGRGPMS